MAVVTGSARGIGKNIVRRFADEGAHLLLVDVRADDLELTLKDMPNGWCKMLAVDLTDRAAPDRVREAINDAFGKIDILGNNAGVGIGGQIEDFSDEEWDRTLAINLSDATFVGLAPLLTRASTTTSADAPNRGRPMLTSRTTWARHSGSTG